MSDLGIDFHNSEQRPEIDQSAAQALTLITAPIHERGEAILARSFERQGHKYSTYYDPRVTRGGQIIELPKDRTLLPIEATEITSGIPETDNQKRMREAHLNFTDLLMRRARIRVPDYKPEPDNIKHGPNHSLVAGRFAWGWRLLGGDEEMQIELLASDQPADQPRIAGWGVRAKNWHDIFRFFAADPEFFESDYLDLILLTDSSLLGEGALLGHKYPDTDNALIAKMMRAEAANMKILTPELYKQALKQALPKLVGANVLMLARMTEDKGLSVINRLLLGPKPAVALPANKTTTLRAA